jgi:hypothetical protein
VKSVTGLAISLSPYEIQFPAIPKQFLLLQRTLTIGGLLPTRLRKQVTPQQRYAH